MVLQKIGAGSHGVLAAGTGHSKEDAKHNVDATKGNRGRR